LAQMASSEFVQEAQVEIHEWLFAASRLIRPAAVRVRSCCTKSIASSLHPGVDGNAYLQSRLLSRFRSPVAP
jgi:hypothetical protein